jgi:hypothetical protein
MGLIEQGIAKSQEGKGKVLYDESRVQVTA